MTDIFEPKCKIRFISEPNPENEYIALTLDQYRDMLIDSHTLTAITTMEDVDSNYCISEYIKSYIEEADINKLSEYAEHIRTGNMTVEETINSMSLDEIVNYEMTML